MDSFEVIIETVLASQYVFVRLDDRCELSRGKFVLRHDVDIDPQMALSLGKAESRKGVVGNYFFQLNADSYSMLSRECLNIMEQLRDMGHLVGLHVDSSVFPETEESISESLEWFSKNVTTLDRAVSFHRPSEKILGKRYNSFVSAYDREWFDINCYASDSRGEAGFYAKLETMLENQAPQIQLLSVFD